MDNNLTVIQKTIDNCKDISDLNHLQDIIYRRFKEKRESLAVNIKYTLVIGKTYQLSDGSTGVLDKINRTKCVMTINNRTYNVPLSMIIKEVK